MTFGDVIELHTKYAKYTPLKKFMKLLLRYKLISEIT